RRRLPGRFSFGHEWTLPVLGVLRPCCTAIINIALQQSHPHIGCPTVEGPRIGRAWMFPILLANLVTQVMTPRPPPRRERRPGRVRKGRRKPINLGLQGGGAHGAFTWGVLDQLLDDARLEIEGISGAWAGALNAVMLADGPARGGPDEARQRLADFWRAVSVDGHLPDLQRGVVERLFPFVPREGLWFGAMSRMLSPYDLNPLNINPHKDVIERFVDFEAVRAHHGL